MGSDLLDLVIRTTAVLACALAVTALLRRRSAALRHQVLFLGLLASVLVVPLTALVPGWYVLPAPTSAPADVEIRTSPAGMGASVPGAARPSLPTAATPTSAASVVLVIWALGFGIAGLRLLLGWQRVSRLARATHAPLGERWPRLVADACRMLAVSRPVQLAVTNCAPMIATFGDRRPTILLPTDVNDWPDDRARAVLLHELAHVARHDWATQCLAEVVRAANWFNPIAHWTCTRLRHESERACDDRVLAAGVPADRYAEDLIELARTLRTPSPWATVVSMAQPSTLEGRVAAMLNPNIDRRKPTARTLAWPSLLLTACLVLFAALRVSGQGGPAVLEGTLFDPSGGVLPGATVTLIDAQEVKWSTTTDPTGRFSFSPVGTGGYQLVASLPGFKTALQGVTVGSASNRHRAITMHVGSLEETITVTARRPSRATATSGPVRIGGQLKAPRKVAHVAPIYPAGMRDAGLEGVVLLDTLIGVDGNVVSTRLSSTQIEPAFAAAAMDAVKQWRFTPTLLNGMPVEVAMTVSVSFSLTD